MIRSLSSYSRVTCSSIHAVESGLMKVHLSKALGDWLLSWICLQRPDVVLSTSVAEMVRWRLWRLWRCARGPASPRINPSCPFVFSVYSLICQLRCTLYLSVNINLPTLCTWSCQSLLSLSLHLRSNRWPVSACTSYAFSKTVSQSQFSLLSLREDDK